MRRTPIAVFLPFLLCTLAAHADTLSTFSIVGASNTYGMANDFNTISGTTTIDTTLGRVETISFDAGGILQSGVDFEDSTYLLVGSDAAKFTISGTSLIGFKGDNFNLNGPNDLYVGHLLLNATTTGMPAVSPTAVTPEPASVALLGTGLLAMGLLGVAGVLRRREHGLRGSHA